MLAAQAAILIAALAGCSPSDPPRPSSTPDPGYQVPDYVHYVDHWVPTPAVDLMSADGTFIRAFAEGDTLRIFNMDEEKGSYPGFTKASSRIKHVAGGSGMPALGFEIYWVLDFSIQPDGTATANVCEISAISPDGPPANPSILKSTLTYHKTGAPPPANQYGSARAPAESVFGDWYATAVGGSLDLTSVQPCLDSKPTIGPNPDNSPGWPAAPS
jgi:hypothetical protein